MSLLFFLLNFLAFLIKSLRRESHLVMAHVVSLGGR
jgi:phosphate starvation-inducible membrane PsiE